MARLSASVQLNACTTQKGSRAPSARASVSRASNTSRPAASERAWPARPGFALKRVMASCTARSVHAGFGWLVAALSR